MIRTFSLFLLIVAALVAPVVTSAQEQLGVVCIKGSTIVVRTKCLSGEKVATVSLLTKKGLIGDTGSAGGTGVPSRQAVFTTHASQDVPFSGAGLVRTETCPFGKIIVGGGCRTANTGAAIVQSYPTENLST